MSHETGATPKLLGTQFSRDPYRSHDRPKAHDVDIVGYEVAKFAHSGYREVYQTLTE
jgi:hypothetical protein